jgi:hypothetical protein
MHSGCKNTIGLHTYDCKGMQILSFLALHIFSFHLIIFKYLYMYDDDSVTSRLTAV